MLFHFRKLRFKLHILTVLLVVLWLNLCISFWPVTTKVWIQVQASLYGICGVHIDTELSLSLSASVINIYIYIHTHTHTHTHMPPSIQPSVIPSHEALMVFNPSN
jgi:hypothetical protein